MDRETIAAICRRVVAGTLGILEEDIPYHLGEMINEFVLYHYEFMSYRENEKIFQKQIDDWLKMHEALIRELNSARQHHHDVFVRQFLNGTISPQDMPQYDLAMAREEAGLVEPLPE